MTEMQSHRHIVEFDADNNRITISRLLADGSQHLYTEIGLVWEEDETSTEAFKRIGRRLGEDLALDSPEGRRFFEIST